MDRTLYTARAQRGGSWWAISVAGLPGVLTQVRRLDQAEAMTREVIALVLDVPEDSFDVEVIPDLTEPQRAAWTTSTKPKPKPATPPRPLEGPSASRMWRPSSFETSGLTVRDAAVLLGVSYRRVSQLTHDRPGRFMATKKSDGAKFSATRKDSGRS
jgi:predicted RNase H-like HicB family nuclease